MGGRRFLRTSAAVCPGSGKGCSLRVPVGEPLFPLPLKALLSLSFQNSPARGVPRPRKWPFARNLASVSCEMAGKNFVQLFRTPHKKIRWEGLAELSRPQTTEGKEAPSFPATRASEMTPLMTDRATFLKESSPVRHASLCRKRPEAFFDKLKGTSLRMSLCFGFRSRWPPRPPVIRRSVRNEFPRRNSHLNSRCRSERRVFFSGPAILPESGLIAACNPPRSRKHRAV